MRVFRSWSAYVAAGPRFESRMERPVAVALSLVDRILAARFTTISCDR